MPVIDLKRCEGKGDCVRVCPENVFEIRRIAETDYNRLSMLHKLKQRVHGAGRLRVKPRCLSRLWLMCYILS